jgi:xylulokinase
VTRVHEGLLIGVDLGTSSMKGVVVTTAGELVAEARVEYPMVHPRPGWNENDATDWVRALHTVVGRLTDRVANDGPDVIAMGIVAQRDPLVMLDGDGLPTGHVISWTDGRTGPQLRELTEAICQRRLTEITGGRPVVGGGLLNLLWAREHAAEAWSATVRVASPKDYLLTGLGAQPGTDPTTPTRSIAFDVAENDWSTEILDAVGIAPDLFDPVSRVPTDAVGTVAEGQCARMGLPANVVLSAGCADDHAAALGSGAVRPGQRSLGTGTCSSWRVVVPSYQPDLLGRVDCSPYVVPTTFMREVTVDSVGSSLRWFRDTICPDLRGETAYADILTMAARSPRGAEGVKFLPFVDGAQRAPFFQPGASAGFTGISSRHTREHLARAVVESIALLYIPTLALIGGANGAPLTIVDGEAASQFWNQLKADVMGCPVRTTEVPDAAAMGAAVLASVAAGVYDDLESAVAAMIRWTPALEPDPQANAHYRELWQDYAATFEAMRPLYEAAAP